MTTEFIDSPHKTLQALDELIESAEKIRRKCRNKNYYANDMLCKIINEIHDIQYDIEENIPEWEKIMEEDMFPDGRPSIDEHLSTAYCDAIKIER